jgi:hypothetical protein
MNVTTNPYMNENSENWEKYLAAHERLLAATNPQDVKAAEKDVVHYRALIAIPNIISGMKQDLQS